jgi:hypothetical protein
VLIRDGLVLVRVEHAEAYLRACEQERTPVLGIEGFRISKDDEIRPDLDAITGWGALSLAQSIRASRLFVRVLTSPGLYLDFTLQEPAPPT